MSSFVSLCSHPHTHLLHLPPVLAAQRLEVVVVIPKRVVGELMDEGVKDAVILAET
jgi:hypothetical protein